MLIFGVILKPKNGFTHPQKWPLACPDWKGRPLLVRDWSAIDPPTVFLQCQLTKAIACVKPGCKFLKRKVRLHVRRRLRWANKYKENFHICLRAPNTFSPYIHAAMSFSQTEKHTYTCVHLYTCKGKYVLYSVKILLVGSKKQNALAIILLWILAFVWLMQSTCAVILKSSWVIMVNLECNITSISKNC